MKTYFKSLMLCLLLFLSALFSCKKEVAAVPPAVPAPQPPATTKTYTYLALGDSYTVGTDIDSVQTYPVQIAALLKPQGFSIQSLDVIAQNGWTTANLSNAIAQSNNKKVYNMVSLLIGVNNQYQGLSKDQFRIEFAALVKTAINYGGKNPKNVVILSIPDYGVTTNYAGNMQAIGTDIDAFNLIIQDESQKAGVAYIDITTVSRTAYKTPDLIAYAGPHFSGKMHTKWANLALPVAKQLLEKQ
jgi:lysophospholipase L1-like esterase